MERASHHLIEATGVAGGYGKERVLSGVDLAMEAGSFFIIAGPNGTGKTTLLKTLAGLNTPSKGSIHLDGKPVHRFSRKALARRIAYLPQSVESAFDLSVRDVVLMGRAPHLGLLGIHSDEDIQIAEEAMAFTGVSHLAHRTLDALSGGERQRVFISRAVCQQTDFILLDEPTSALDLAHQIRVMDLMETLKKERGTGIIMVSHDLNLAAMYADTLCLIHKGKVAALGTPQEVLCESRLKTIYGCAVCVEKGSQKGLIHVTPLPGRLDISTGAAR
ncbi:MAG: ABC transporter ATP-binding protein [Desulfobacterales bacterium]|nr:ABC transporter ATP-binding protein [Desulfobacterales bacterium]